MGGMLLLSKGFRGQQPLPSPVPPAAVLPADEPTDEQLGDAWMAHQRYQAAIAAYQKAPKKSAQLLNKLGIAYQMLFDTTDAIRCYRAAIKLDSKNARFYNNLGTALDAAKSYGAAEKSYRRAIKLNPEFALAWKNLGSDRMTQHNYRAGAAAYQKALELDPHVFEDQNSMHIANPAPARDRGAMNYYMARGCARSGQIKCALNYLRLSVNEGFATPKRMAAEPDFSALHGLPAFEQMLNPEAPQTNLP